jgi:hypothetical protein
MRRCLLLICLHKAKTEAIHPHNLWFAGVWCGAGCFEHLDTIRLLAFVADIRMVANYLLRPGNTGATTNFLSFLENAICGIDYIKFCRTAIFFIAG